MSWVRFLVGGHSVPSHISGNEIAYQAAKKGFDPGASTDQVVLRVQFPVCAGSVKGPGVAKTIVGF